MGSVCPLDKPLLYQEMRNSDRLASVRIFGSALSEQQVERCCVGRMSEGLAGGTSHRGDSLAAHIARVNRALRYWSKSFQTGMQSSTEIPTWPPDANLQLIEMVVATFSLDTFISSYVTVALSDGRLGVAHEALERQRRDA